MTKIVNYIVIAVILSTVFTSCDDTVEVVPKKNSGFSNPKEFLANPSVSNAVKASGIKIYDGNKPPILDGNYFAEGKISNAVGFYESFIGLSVGNEFSVSAQALLGQSEGKLNFHEKDEGVPVWGKGAYITGNNENFTIYLEIKQSGLVLELPDDVLANMVFLVSGNRSSNGDLTAKWMWVITNIAGTTDKYDSMEFGDIGSWYMTEGSWEKELIEY